MKKILLFLMVVLLARSAFAREFEYEYGELECGTNTLIYSVLDEDAKTCEVVGINGCNSPVAIPSIAKDGDTEYTVISIGSKAFDGCRSLTRIRISNSVTSIGSYAFDNCTKMYGIDIPNSVTSIGHDAFKDCVNLTSVYIKDLSAWLNISFKNPQANPLWNSATLCLNYQRVTDLEIPEGITAIPSYAFYGCSSLTTLNIPNSITSIGDCAFTSCTGLTTVNIPNSVTSIGYRTFYNCTALTSIDIPNSVTSIGDCAFTNCTALTSVNIPNSVTSIGYRTFYNCTALTSIDIPNSVTSIGEDAFYNCRALTRVNIPNAVTSIGCDAFYNCFGLKSVEIKDLSAWLNIRFEDGDANPLYNGNLDVIDNSASLYLDGKLVSNLEIPEGITTILPFAFYGYRSLTSVSIPNSAISVEDNAFCFCSALERVSIGASVNSIGEHAFSRCDKINEVVVLAMRPPLMNTTSFSDYCYTYASIALPESSIEEYLTTNWSRFRSIEFPNVRWNYGSSSYSDGVLRYTLGTSFDGQKVAMVIGLQDAEATEVSIPERFSDSTGQRYYVYGIGWHAFANRSDLKLVSFNRRCQIKSIGESAFEGTPIEAIMLPESVKIIGKNAFRNCSSLTSISLPAYLQSLGTGSFTNCSSLESIAIPQQVTLIGDRTFMGNTALSDLTFGSGLTTIGNEAFSGCPAIEEIILPPAVESIGESAFAGDVKLTSIIMGHNVKTIGEKAFDGCPASTVSITAQTPPTAPNTTFSNYSGKLYVQGKRAAEAYYDALTCWDRFDAIVMIEPTGIELDEQPIAGVPGDTFQLHAMLIPENVSLPQIFWRSTNSEIATVDSNGLVTLHAEVNNGMVLAPALYAYEQEASSPACKIIAESLYSDGPVAEMTVATQSSVETVVQDNIDYDAPLEVYNLQGMLVARDMHNLGTGIYIVRQGNRVIKITVK